MVEAFDCGAVVNPNHLKNQIEGAIVQGLGGALFEEIRFDNGKILNAKFSRYRVPRFKDLPPIEVVIVDRKDVPSAGAGETPIVGIAARHRQRVLRCNRHSLARASFRSVRRAPTLVRIHHSHHGRRLNEPN